MRRSRITSSPGTVTTSRRAATWPSRTELPRPPRRTDPDGAVEKVASVYQNASAQMHVRPVKEIERFFDGKEMIDPGVVGIAGWRPAPGTRPDSLYGGVGRTPAP
jgi:S-adenosyl methyltransferase